MVLITIVTGAYKPTYNWGASHCPCSCGSSSNLPPPPPLPLPFPFPSSSFLPSHALSMSGKAQDILATCKKRLISLQNHWICWKNIQIDTDHTNLNGTSGIATTPPLRFGSNIRASRGIAVALRVCDHFQLKSAKCAAHVVICGGSTVSLTSLRNVKVAHSI